MTNPEDHPRSRLLRFAKNLGYRDLNHLGNFVSGDEIGLKTISESSGLSEKEVLKACGFKEKPKVAGVNLHATCHVGGVLEPSQDIADNGIRSDQALKSIPNHFSLISRFGPPRNQGAVGTCTSYAGAAMLESQYGALCLSVCSTKLQVVMRSVQ